MNFVEVGLTSMFILPFGTNWGFSAKFFVAAMHVGIHGCFPGMQRWDGRWAWSVAACADFRASRRPSNTYNSNVVPPRLEQTDRWCEYFDIVVHFCLGAHYFSRILSWTSPLIGCPFSLVIAFFLLIFTVWKSYHRFCRGHFKTVASLQQSLIGCDRYLSEGRLVREAVNSGLHDDFGSRGGYGSNQVFCWRLSGSTLTAFSYLMN